MGLAGKEDEKAPAPDESLPENGKVFFPSGTKGLSQFPPPAALARCVAHTML